ncbi:MAG: hypothetical protein LBT64_03120 [Puniceicoccales bacterium]|jgi:hypothetical protein|nr:hypothetical protein [Puniceicoccales bacterium]
MEVNNNNPSVTVSSASQETGKKEAAESAAPKLTVLNATNCDVSKNADLKSALERAEKRGDLPKAFKKYKTDSLSAVNFSDYAIIKIGDLCMLAKLDPKTNKFESNVSANEVADLGLHDSAGNDIGDLLKENLKKGERYSLTLGITTKDGGVIISAELKHNPKIGFKKAIATMEFKLDKNQLRASMSEADIREMITNNETGTPPKTGTISLSPANVDPDALSEITVENSIESIADDNSSTSSSSTSSSSSTGSTSSSSSDN